MASIGVFKETPRYTSGRVSPISSPEDRERDSYFFTSLPSDRAEELPWIKLFHADDAYKAFVNDLFCLNFEEDGEVPVASHVLELILELTPFAKRALANDWSNPWVTTDSSGGIRLSWRHGTRELRAVVPANLQRERYLYWQDGQKHGAIPNFVSATLFTGLRWLNGRDNRESAA